MNFCPSCHTGRLQRRSMVYVEWHGDGWLVVDKMPAIVCDICGERAYDHDAMEYLQQLISSSPLANSLRTVPTQDSRTAKHRSA